MVSQHRQLKMVNGVNKMTRKEILKTQGDFSIYGVFRFTSYLMASISLYLGDLQIAGIAFGFGATLGFIRRIARIWEQ